MPKFLVSIALFASTLAFSAHGAQTISVPDMSGAWGHLVIPPFEPPLSGPGPVMNTVRVGSAEVLTNNPENKGQGASRLVSNFAQLVGDFTNPILKSEAAEIVRQYGVLARAGTLTPMPSNLCRPNGVPFIFWNLGMQMIQEPDKVTLLYVNDHEVRHVRLNAQHPQKVTPSWYGDSVGHYEGDTLVIDTIGFKKGPHSMIDQYGTPFSDALHIVERYRLIDNETAQTMEARADKDGRDLDRSDSGIARDPAYRGKALLLEFTVEDSGVFTTPWSATITYRRPSLPVGGWPEIVCADSPYGYFPGGRADIPVAEKSEF